MKTAGEKNCEKREDYEKRGVKNFSRGASKHLLCFGGGQDQN